MEGSLLHDLAAKRASRWRREEFGFEVLDGPITDKPASWLVLSLNGVLGQLTLWVSGEAEMDWGTPEDGGERHYDLGSSAELERCVDDLELQLRLLS
ncbi:hypothetical protein AFL01nite_04150 [Aeromicrobium flavum]|uniref:Uncharacterized protein n=1 Tax=Aeromicrobium flavum TaxID=416568 RepID=A0A512HRK7_9ACTN|nr:hypothetical protein [Aeromicrobium flavum]GEO88088.1 hypothetical protein AFL01nite_04150 [Aeromicrobium flavum]